MSKLFLHTRLRAAVEESGMPHKLIAFEAEINKKTLESWLSNDPPIPNAQQFYRVAKVLGKPLDWFFSEAQIKYAPPRLARLVQDLELLSDDQLDAVCRLIRPWADTKRQERAG